MAEIDFRQHAPKYKQDLEESTLASNTIVKRQNMVEEFIQHCEENKLTIDTQDFYESVDAIREYFEREDITIHGTKVSAIRDFLEYIGTQVDSRTEDQLDDIKEKISLAKLKGSNQEIGKMDKKELENKLLEDEEIEAAKEAGSDKAELVIDLMMDTAARPGEIVGLKPEDIDFERGSLKIQRTWSDAKGFIQHNPKHDSYRTVKISSSTSKSLREWIEEHRIASDEFIFDSYRSDVYRPLKDAFTKANIRMDSEKGTTIFTPHWLRHNACTRLIQNGNSKEKVQEYMGHSSVQITEVYEHFDENQVVDVELA